MNMYPKLLAAKFRKHLSPVLLSSIALILFSGCVTGRRTIELDVAGRQHGALSKGEVVIAKLEDNRYFENKPSDPSTPSIKGDIEKLSPEQKSVMIGRQRNSYGMAIGDVALPEGDSVPLKVEELLREAFARRGYSVNSENADGSENSIEVNIEKFWAWFSPGMWAVSFEAHVQCDLTIKKGDTVVEVSAKGEGLNKGQIASNANWQLAYNRSFEDFLANLETELKKVGF